MERGDELPEEFLARLRALEASYLSDSDPIRQSGFGGGAERWRREREPILDGVDADGDFLDVGCANGFLLECLVDWARERGRRIVPYGVDIGPDLIAAARRRLPEFADHFLIANAWEWRPPRRFRFVYTLYDCVPERHLAAYVRRLLERVVEPGGRLIVGAYGSRSEGRPPYDVSGALAAAGLALSGDGIVGEPPIVAFAWIDA